MWFLQILNISSSNVAKLSVKGIFGGGTNAAGNKTTVIDFVTIASTGNAADFGDLTVARSQHGGSSNGHGGL